ncbi:MAG: hypothetical protein SGI99_11435 [Pseudomonadota bacterium]|nr:hypothetical protein [Pseudomonadota bacterium]
MNRAKNGGDLFGEKPRRNVRRIKRTEVANGYAAPPGTGPSIESCSTCAHCKFRELSNRQRFYKCGRMLSQWDRSRSTDILIKSPACRLWEAGEPSLSTTYIRSW